jgi:GntR family transcriptional regulator
MTELILSRIRVDKTAPVPIYQQLQDQLEKLIADGTWRPHEPLPSETVLAERLRISVMTVRQAMARLVNQGLIYREKGRGTFVTPRPLEHRLHRLESFTEDMQARGIAPSSKTLVFEIIPAPDNVADQMGLARSKPVLHLKRLRLVDGRPVALHDAYIPRPNFQRDELEAIGSLYALLEQKGFELCEADETLEAIVADEELSHRLRVPRGAPILKAARLTWDRQRIPVEMVAAFYRADFYRYAVRLRR